MTHAQAVKIGAAERYLLDEMSELERHAFEHHYFSCLECAQDVRAGGFMRDGVKAGLIDALPENTVRFERQTPWRASVVLPWALAATLALAVGYQSIVRPPQPRLEPHVIVPVTLRPATRGAEAVVPLTPGAAAVTLAVDVNPGEPGDLTYELRAANDRSVASGRVQAPVPGAPLLLLVPVWTLRPAEHYILSVRHATTGNLVSEFRFGVTQ